METFVPKKLIEKIEKMVEIFLNKPDLKNKIFKNENMFDDFDIFLEQLEDINEKSISLNDVEELTLFFENVFNLDDLSIEKYIQIYYDLKEIEVNLTSLKLKKENVEFEPLKEIIQGNIDFVSKGVVLLIGDDLYLVKSDEVKKTSKGYEIMVQLITKGKYSYVNNIYIDIRNECYFIIGKIEDQ